MPADTARLTRVEQLPKEKREFVDDLLRERPRPSTQEISGWYEEEFHEHLAASTISSYLARRLEVARKAIDEQRVEYIAKIEAIGATGIDEATAASIWEAIRTMTPAQLILLRSVETKRKELALKEEAQATRNKELQLKIDQFERREKEAEEAIEQASEKLGKGQAITVEDVQRLRERVIGGPAQAPAGH